MLVSLQGVKWEQFKAIEANLDSVRDVRLSYLQGILEIMSPISVVLSPVLGAAMDLFIGGSPNN